jgi:prephenate dehydrogenase
VTSPSGGLRTAVVVGTGLIGTSIALALRERGIEVWLSDTDPGAAGWPPNCAAHSRQGRCPAADIAVLAVPRPPPRGRFASAQSRAWQAAHRRGGGKRAAAAPGPRTGLRPHHRAGHPMSGRERSVRAARADLFTGQPWVICR